MEVKVMVHSENISEEELLLMLQAVRDAQLAHFSTKDIAIWLETNPEISVEDAKKLLGRIQPPFAINKTIDEFTKDG